MKLLKCPFCGGKAELLDEPGTLSPSIQCTKCFANVIGTSQDNNRQMDIKSAVALWNTREVQKTAVKPKREYWDY